MPVLQFRRILHVQPPVPAHPAGFRPRHFAGIEDIDSWLELRERAFRGEMPPARRWSAREFEREFLSQPWWLAERFFVLESASFEGQAPRWAGSVVLSERRGSGDVRACVHWLMVDPDFRRRGLARWLLSALICAAWNLGLREVLLESHSGWSAALKCYRAAGFAPISGA